MNETAPAHAASRAKGTSTGDAASHPWALFKIRPCILTPPPGPSSAAAFTFRFLRLCTRFGACARVESPNNRAPMNDVIDRATRVLRDVFGYAAFRGEQAEIVGHIAGGGD